MTVNQGIGGQQYKKTKKPKITAARKKKKKTGRNIDLEVDGGIKATNVQRVVKAGANIVVMGTEIFHSGDYAAKIREVRKIVSSQDYGTH